MAKKNDFTKRANDFLTMRLGPVQRLGELLDAKAEKEAELKDCDAAIEKAVLECIEAGWKPAELTELGVPKTAIQRRQPRTATLEPRTSDHGTHTDSGENSADGGPVPEPSP
ncbi:hypothetical protein F0Q45_08375 [Mycobacterium simiae]|uniref:Uncharacterized protein n=1 Tax=Mycobacterium simiae TaxID=1784 RepID=A0A5B1BTB6_MYCSI|nr:hypothetical protein [Mycobacterium simiae]KAA1250700.1 hypothetical protein F0Q45_08375 [Mycobacterium simiae]